MLQRRPEIAQEANARRAPREYNVGFALHTLVKLLRAVQNGEAVPKGVQCPIASAHAAGHALLADAALQERLLEIAQSAALPV